MSAVPFPAFLTPSQLAKEIGTSVDTVLAWIHSKQLIATDVSRSAGERPRWRIDRNDLAGFLNRRRTEQPAEPTARPRRGRPSKQYV